MTEDFEGMPFEDLDPAFAAIAMDMRDTAYKKKRKSRPRTQMLLTDELVRSAVCGEHEIWMQDEENPSLALRTHPTGGKSYYFISSERELQDSRRTHLGNAQDYTVAEARIKAQWEESRKYAAQLPSRMHRSLRIEAVVAEYLIHHPAADSDWFKTVDGLFQKYLLPRYGSFWLAGIRKDQWLLLIEKAALEQRSRGVNLHKSLRAFLSWAVRHGLLEANPLAKTSLDLPPIRSTSYLKDTELAAIYDAAQQLGPPWSAMLGLVILTGEAMEDIRRIQHGDVDWNLCTWTVEWETSGDFQPRPLRKIALSDEAFTLLAAYKDVKRYFFQSPRALLPSPINFHTAIVERLNSAVGETAKWTLADCRRAAYREIQRRGSGDEALRLWSEDFASMRSKRTLDNSDDGVVL